MGWLAVAGPSQENCAGCSSEQSLKAPVWACRVIFAIVFALNVTCALEFIIAPEAFLGAYELSGVGGAAAIQGMGIAFLMWNVTYPLFIWHPARSAVLGALILIQQLIGCLGETVIILSIPASSLLLASSVARFMAFDGAGLILMAFAWGFLGMRLRQVRSRQTRP